MKILMSLFIFLSVQKDCNQKTDLHFINATSQNWSGGAAGSHGTYYKIYFLMKENPDYKFDSLWVDGRRFTVNVMKSPMPTDTMMLLVNDSRGMRNPETHEELLNSVEAKSPIETSTIGVLGYFFQGQRKYFSVPEWKKLKALTYP
ncbi:MAG: hypothetical protein ACHQD9_08685 [Chitinophagales bacterium]